MNKTARDLERRMETFEPFVTTTHAKMNHIQIVALPPVVILTPVAGFEFTCPFCQAVGRTNFYANCVTCPACGETMTAKLPVDNLACLNERETTVLYLVAEGYTNREIAGKIFLSSGTVRNLVSVILSKLNVSNRAEAASVCARATK